MFGFVTGYPDNCSELIRSERTDAAVQELKLLVGEVQPEARSILNWWINCCTVDHVVMGQRRLLSSVSIDNAASRYPHPALHGRESVAGER